jgi:hypothetical protein
MRIQFNRQQLSAGNYELYIKDPGGLDTSLGGFRVTASNPITFTVSAGYAPLIPLYGKSFNAAPAGAYARFGVIPFERDWGSIGAELEPFWNFLGRFKDGYDAIGHITGGHINLLYQRELPIRNLALNLRLGSGISSILDFHFTYGEGDSPSFSAWYGSIGGGASVQWSPVTRFFLEAGLAYNHIFTINDNPHHGYLRPVLGAGARF